MIDFVRTYDQFRRSKENSERIQILTEYFSKLNDLDLFWAIDILRGRKFQKTVQLAEIKKWVLEESNIPLWLFSASHQKVGDVSETLSLIFSRKEIKHPQVLNEILFELASLKIKPVAEIKPIIIRHLGRMNVEERRVFIKMLTGSFRWQPANHIIAKSLTTRLQLKEYLIAKKLTEHWQAEDAVGHKLFFHSEENSAWIKPYSFHKMIELNDIPKTFCRDSNLKAEWTFEGLEIQLIKRKRNIHLWTVDGEYITHKIPELDPLLSIDEDGFVVMAKLIAKKDGQLLSRDSVQKRLDKKIVSKKTLSETPLIVYCNDLFEFEGKDLSRKPYETRIESLNKLLNRIKTKWPGTILKKSLGISYKSWIELEAKKREKNKPIKGHLLFFDLNSQLAPVETYLWKPKPMTILTVLLYATVAPMGEVEFLDFTFGVRKGQSLVPIAKIQNELGPKELIDVAAFINRHTIERFGPVRSVMPELIFEISFEKLQVSKRRKSGLGLVKPKIVARKLNCGIKDIEEHSVLLDLLEQAGIEIDIQ